MTPRALRTVVAAAATVLTGSVLDQLFRERGWVLPALAGVALAVAVGALGRRARLPAAVVPLLTPLGLVGLVTAVGSPGDAWLGVIPTGATLGTLRDLVSAGFSDVRDYATPVPATPGLVLLTTAGVYVVAALVDLLAVTAARPVLAGLPLLALFTVPAVLASHGAGALHFVLAAGGWVALLALDARERAGRWGRVLGAQPEARLGGPLIGAAGSRLAGVSLALAAAVPLLLPSLGNGLLHGSGGIGGGGGDGSVTVVAPLVTVASRLHDPQDRRLFTVATEQPDYYRLTSLDAFDGSSFTLVQDTADAGRRVDGVLPAPTPGLAPGVATRQVDAEVAVEPTLAEPYLPLPYSPVDVHVSGRWQLAPHLRTVFSLRDTTAGLSYTVRSAAPQPTPLQLRAAARAWTPGSQPADTEATLRTDVALPSTLTSTVVQAARRASSGRTTDYDRLLALQAFFTGGSFRYDLDAPVAAGNKGIEGFLGQRVGYCEQFASVFTLMARSLGVPARVAVGFTPGTLDRVTGRWTVTTRDAHAWSEAWFDGVGWVRFEPTPRGDIANAQPDYLSPAPAPRVDPTTDATASPTPARTSSAGGGTRDALPKGAGAGAAPAISASGGAGTLGRDLIVVAIVVLSVLALLLVPALVRVLLRRRRARVAAGTRGGGDAGGGDAGGRDAGAAHAAWSELLDTALDLRLPLSAADSPRATSRRLAGLLSTAGRPPTSGRGGYGPADVLGDGLGDSLGDSLGEAGRGARRVGAVLHEAPGDPYRAPSGGAVLVAGGPEEALTRVTRAEERARYAPRAGVPGTSGSAAGSGLAEDTEVVRRALLQAQPRAARVQAALVPRSVLARARERVGDAVERAGNARSRPRRSRERADNG